MSPEQLGASGVAFTVSAFFLLIAYAVAHRRSVLDAYRQELFIVRDRLWDYAFGEGHLSNPAYLRVRRYVNGAIRMAPLTRLTFLMSIVPHAPAGRSIQDVVSTVQDAALRKQLGVAVAEVRRLMMRHVLVAHFPDCIVGWPLWLSVRKAQSSPSTAIPKVRILASEADKVAAKAEAGASAFAEERAEATLCGLTPA